MSKRVTLESLIDRDFADGYAEYKDVVDRNASAAHLLALPPEQRAALRINHLLTVAMVEAMHEVERDFEIHPAEGVVLLWQGVGVCLAMINGQGFTTCFGQVRKQMMASLADSYNRTGKAIAVFEAGVEPDEGGAA